VPQKRGETDKAGFGSKEEKDPCRGKKKKRQAKVEASGERMSPISEFTLDKGNRGRRGGGTVIVCWGKKKKEGSSGCTISTVKLRRNEPPGKKEDAQRPEKTDSGY